jgi:hypothetical protein
MFVDRRNGGTASSAGPSAGTSAAVNRSRMVISGVAGGEGDFAAAFWAEHVE